MSESHSQDRENASNRVIQNTLDTVDSEIEHPVDIPVKPFTTELKKHSRDSLHSEQRLRLTEVFHSLQGEGITVGEPTVFVRLTGCPLRCQYCDSEYSFYGGHWTPFEEIFSAIESFKVKYVCVTGGEPLAQPNCINFLYQLCERGYAVSLETSGAMDITPVDTRVSRVLDIKTPGSKEVDKNIWTNIHCLTSHDQVKFVLCSRSDYIWAKNIIKQYQLIDKCLVLFSPSFHQLDGTELANWIIADKLSVRFQVQLHKYLWNDEPGR